jgi:hypothetical protein
VLFVVGGALVRQPALDAGGVVEAFDVVEKRGAEIIATSQRAPIGAFVSLLGRPHVSGAMQFDAEESGCRCHVLGRHRVGEHHIDKLWCEGRYDTSE